MARLVVDDGNDGFAARLEDEIYRFNVEVTGFADGKRLRVVAQNDHGVLLGGVSGWTWGGAGHIATLWVRAEDRGCGLGRRMLAAAEEEVLRRGCDRVALSTHSFQAPGFYAKFGYRECGRTPGYPAGHSQIHLVKELGKFLGGQAGDIRLPA